jgi:hypothetical protein
MRLLLAALLLCLATACSPRGAGNHENVGDNASGIAELKDAGYDVAKPIAMTFGVLCDGETDARSVEKTLGAKGYEVEVWELDGGIWQVIATKTFVPELAAVNANELEVVAASDAARGYYEGWGVE